MLHLVCYGSVMGWCQPCSRLRRKDTWAWRCTNKSSAPAGEVLADCGSLVHEVIVNEDITARIMLMEHNGALHARSRDEAEAWLVIICDLPAKLSHSGGLVRALIQESKPAHHAQEHLPVCLDLAGAWLAHRHLARLTPQLAAHDGADLTCPLLFWVCASPCSWCPAQSMAVWCSVRHSLSELAAAGSHVLQQAMTLCRPEATFHAGCHTVAVHFCALKHLPAQFVPMSSRFGLPRAHVALQGGLTRLQHWSSGLALQ